jgi:hypothetical protein
MDAAFWVLDLGYPERVEPDATQLFPETAPTSSRVEYTFPRKGDRAPVKVVWRDGGLVPAAPPEIDDVGGGPPRAAGGQLWIGDEGKLLADIYGRNPRLLDAERHAEVTANPLPERYPRVEGVYGEWIDAIMAGTRSGSDFAEYAGPLTEMVLLSNLAVRMGRTLEFDTSSGDVTNVAVPEDFVRPSYRDGWTL